VRSGAPLRSTLLFERRLTNRMTTRTPAMGLVRLISQRPVLTFVALTTYAVVVTICLWAVFSILLVLAL
jgi:hypothetical protein